MKPSIKSVFLSASVPMPGRSDYADSADPFLIQCAVRELVLAVVRDWQIVWGGHPAITPMIWTICQDLGVSYAERVVLYQSRFFQDQFPEENDRFRNVVFVEAVPGDREASLLKMRREMLSRRDLEAAVFIGGMEGVEAEYSLFTQLQPRATRLVVRSPGGAAGRLGLQDWASDGDPEDIDFARMFDKVFRKQ